MAMHTQESLSGFIASEPTLTFTRSGEARFYATVGQEHYAHQDDGSFQKLDTTFHNLVIYRRSAEIAFERFKKGDKFIAEGYTNSYEYEVDGQTLPGEEFIAKRIGHDTARHAYTVDRTRRAQAADQVATIGSGSAAAAGTAGQQSAERATATESPTAAAEPAPAQRSAGRAGAGRTGLGRRLAIITGHPSAGAAGEPIGL